TLQPDYLPAQLTSDDYPNLIASGEAVDTIAVPAILAVYNWAPNTDRYRRVERFVQAFFSKIADLQKPPFHPKWKEVTLNAELPGWVRFRPAQEWLDRAASTAAASEAAQRRDSAGTVAKSENQEELFQQFLEWQKKRTAKRR